MLWIIKLSKFQFLYIMLTLADSQLNKAIWLAILPTLLIIMEA